MDPYPMLEIQTIQVSALEDFPTELWHEVIESLKPWDVLSLSAVSTAIRPAALDIFPH